MKLLDGICMHCNTRFWWTGHKSTVPHCMDCGRHHTDLDFARAKIAAEAEREAAKQGYRHKVPS